MAAPTKYLFLHVLFCVVVILLYTYVSANTNRKIEQLFKQYIAKYNKTHVEGSKEYIFRMNVFEKSLIRHAKLNSKTVSIENAQFGINKFSDMTPEEFQVKFLKLKQEPAEPFQPLSLDLWLGNKPIATTERTQKVDWRKTNKVTAVNNQKDCGACWAFSSVEIIESMVAIRKGVLAPLSVQQMTDCARFGNRGCQGGNIETALMWLKSTNTALVSSKKYPLTWKTETCKLTNSTEGVTISSHATYGLVQNEEKMVDLIENHGPVAVAIDATLWQDYLGGVIQHHCEMNLNHAVEIVGYDLTGNVPYYIVRNSWGTDFGHSGYLYIKIGKNVCGIATSVSIVDV